jgi:hypothetical protein
MDELKQALWRLSRKRQIFRAHNESLKETPVNDATAVVHHWIRENYFDSMMIGLRCLLDRRSGTRSLPKILEELMRNRSAISFERYRQFLKSTKFLRWEEMAKEAYAPFTKDGRNFDSERVRSDLEKLEVQYQDLLHYINNRVAHWSSEPTPDESNITIGLMHAMLDDVSAVFHDYYQLIAGATIADFPEVPLLRGFERAFERMVNLNSGEVK